jgi:glycosyltransferase involved in cell wall biosynthesis
VHYEPELFPCVKFTGVLKKIGYTIFETDRIPKHWVKYCNQMDELWVPSRFNLETFTRSGVKPEKIKLVPIGVDTSFFKRRQEKLPIEEKIKFTFLYTFAFNWRKGFDLLLEAYFKEFTDKDHVSLILKVYEDQGVKQHDIKEIMMDSVADKVDLTRKDAPHLTVIDRPLDQEELLRLYNSCDLYISTDRANGWGMPCMETMAMGKPAATINWSGSTEFMNEYDSLLIEPTGRLVPVDRRLSKVQPLLYSGHKWADVSLGEVRRVMRFAYENPEALKTLAERGEIYIRENFSIEKVAKQLVETVTASEITHKSERLNQKYKVTIQHAIFRKIKRKILMLKHTIGSILTDSPQNNKSA